MTYHKAIHLVGTVTVGPKGQVVIPSEVRESMEINPGDKLVALYLEEKRSVAFITERQAQDYVIKMGEQFTEFKEKLEGNT
jgi:AbrB family looped-hinge helix DNA binding protein